PRDLLIEAWSKSTFSGRRSKGKVRVPPETRAATSRSLDLGFLELDVLAHDGIVLLEAKLLSARARVLLGHVVVTSARGRNQFDLLCYRLGHVALRISALRRMFIGICAHHTRVERAVKL